MIKCKAELDEEVEQVYGTFWKEIVESNGELDLAQVKKELHDFHIMIEEVPKVYMHVTGSQVSKHLTDSEVVCSLADDHYREINTPRQFLESEWSRGDVVSRSGDDEQLILEVDEDRIRVVCIKEPIDGWDELLSEETNLKRRYSFVRRPSEED